ncbi:unnamed protein product [Symbiodinium sp. CCMP2456]|nr:unnamed protein product [Symbiodinium sp. CCMP2456]
MSDDAGEDPLSENETITSSKRSQSKPENQRGPARVAKKAKKALIHKGVITREEARKLGPEEINSMVKEYRKGSSNLSEVLLQQLGENQKENLFKRLFEEHEEFPGMKFPEITAEQRGILDESHVQSNQHCKNMKEHLQCNYMLSGNPGTMKYLDVKNSFLRVRRFGGGLQELSLSGAMEYWGDEETLPSLAKSMHQEKPMKVKFGTSTKAKTHDLTKEQVAKYHLAWVNYKSTSGRYCNATYSKDHLKLHTELQRPKP